jgi:hypothetical protein
MHASVTPFKKKNRINLRIHNTLQKSGSMAQWHSTVCVYMKVMLLNMVVTLPNIKRVLLIWALNCIIPCQILR